MCLPARLSAAAALQALRSVVPYLQNRPIHAVLFVERLDEYRVDSVDHQVGFQTDREGGVRMQMSAAIMQMSAAIMQDELRAFEAAVC